LAAPARFSNRKTEIYIYFRMILSGLGSSVAIATGYGLDGLEIESRWG
jgi:hypothetical protein